MRILLIVGLLVLLAPLALASHNDDDDDRCGISNLTSCLPEIFSDYILVLLNAPLLPLLHGIKLLITAEISIDLFFRLWSIIRYILSFFYIFLFVYTGYTLLLANADPIRRAHAKELLKNTFIMIVLINGSFYLYDLFLKINVLMNAALLNMIDSHFFLLTGGNVINIGLEILLKFSYALTLFITFLFLVLRYIVVCIGVIFVPIALFFYFIPPLKGYGRVMLNILGIFIFITTIDLLIVLACSLIVDLPIFEDFKIVFMIACFWLVNYTLWLSVKYAMKHSTDISIKDELTQAAKYIALLA